MSGKFGLTGFDPLADRADSDLEDRSIFAEATRRIIQNILKSYTGYFDVFAELIQNSLDALEIKYRTEGAKFTPKLNISIDLQNRLIRVIDNGCGMNLQQFKFCLSPSVSFKKRREYRGHKGVGATFLAYGFSLITIQSKQGEQEIAARLRQGRQWADDLSGSIERPRFEEIVFKVPALAAETSGTAVELLLGEGHRPNLLYYGATNANQWLEMLRIKTPLGGVYLRQRDFKANITVRVRDVTGNDTEITATNIAYLFPHDPPVVEKVKDLTEIDKAITAVSGDPATKMERLPGDFKRLDAIYEIWGKDEILSEDYGFLTALDEKQRELTEKHDVIVYGCFMSTAKSWTIFNDECLKIRKGSNLLRGGLQLASDGMVQGDLRVIPLTSSIGYQANAHIVVHFSDGNPDMGRKVFQPELTELAEELARRAVNIFRRYLSLMRPDTGVVSASTTKQLWDWRLRQIAHRDKSPLTFRVHDRTLDVLSEPQQEQDVVALFHQLVGLGFFKGLKFYTTSEHQRYDSLFLTHYPTSADCQYRASDNPLGVAPGCIVADESEPKVLEYKFDLDALLVDFETDVKVPDDIDLVVCWQTGEKFKERYYLSSLLVSDEGSQRTIYGSSHLFLNHSHKLFEVIILKDLISYMLDPSSEVARQKTVYR